MKKKKSKWLGFIWFMLIYAFLLVAAACVGLKLLWDYIDNYEKALPVHKIDRYMQDLSESHIRKLSVGFVSSLDKNVQSDEESYTVIWSCFEDGVDYRKISSESSDDRIVYSIYNSERELGRVTLVKRPDAVGEDTWAIGEEEYDFSFLLNSSSFVIPENWSAYCGGRRLGVQYIVDRNIEYPFLSELYGRHFMVPHLYKYEIGNYLGEVEVKFMDPDGDEQPLTEITDGRAQMRLCSSAIENKMRDFAYGFIPLYINCLSNTTQNANANYSAISRLLVPGGDIDTRLRGAVYGQSFAQSRGTDMREMTINNVYDLGGGYYYLIDVSFSVDTYSDKGVSSSDTNMLLVVIMDDDEVIRADTMSLY